ncbi:MAG: hypothetical protein Q8N51_00870 [Gammaproteobacteria bacterium]|nr:hypothetical protein [Gammaproteobacteria bacterium]
MNRFLRGALTLLLLLPMISGAETYSQRFGFRGATDPAYGATCGGANDDGVPINAAINAANTAGGGTVLLAMCPTQYDISTYILGKSGVTLDCQGATLKAAPGLTTATDLGGVVNTLGTDRFGLVNCGVDASDATADANGVAFGPQNPSAMVTHPMSGDAISDAGNTNIPVGSLVSFASNNAPFAVRLMNASGAVVNGSATATGATITINGITYTGNTSSSSAYVTNLVPSSPNYMGDGNFIRNVTVIGNATPTSQHLINLRLVQGVTIDNVELDGQVVPGPSNTAPSATGAPSTAAYSSDIRSAYTNQNGILCDSCRNITMHDVRGRHITKGVISVIPGANTGASFNPTNISIDQFSGEASSHCLFLHTAYSTAYGVRKARNLTTSNFNCTSPLKASVMLRHTATNPAPAGTIGLDGVILGGMNLDQTSSPMGDKYGSEGILLIWPTSSPLVSRSTVIQNSVIRGGHMGAASGNANTYGDLGTLSIYAVNGLTVSDVIVTDIAATYASTGATAAAIQVSDDVTFNNVTFSNIQRRAFRVLASNRFKGNGLSFIDWDRAADGRQAMSLEGAPYATIIGTSCYQPVGTAPCITATAGVSTLTGIDIRDTTCRTDSGAADCVADYTAAENGTGTSANQTMGQGCFTPTDGGTTYTVNNPKARVASRINVTQKSGTPAAFSVSTADGSFVLTAGAAFATTKYCYDVVN